MKTLPSTNRLLSWWRLVVRMIFFLGMWCLCVMFMCGTFKEVQNNLFSCRPKVRNLEYSSYQIAYDAMGQAQAFIRKTYSISINLFWISWFSDQTSILSDVECRHSVTHVCRVSTQCDSCWNLNALYRNLPWWCWRTILCYKHCIEIQGEQVWHVMCVPQKHVFLKSFLVSY